MFDTRLPGGRAMIVKLERDADDVIALGLEQRGGHGRIHAAGHRDDNAGVLRAAIEIETVAHRLSAVGAPARRQRTASR